MLEQLCVCVRACSFIKRARDKKHGYTNVRAHSLCHLKNVFYVPTSLTWPIVSKEELKSVLCPPPASTTSSLLSVPPSLTCSSGDWTAARSLLCVECLECGICVCLRAPRSHVWRVWRRRPVRGLGTRDDERRAARPFLLLAVRPVLPEARAQRRAAAVPHPRAQQAAPEPERGEHTEHRGPDRVEHLQCLNCFHINTVGVNEQQRNTSFSASLNAIKLKSAPPPVVLIHHCVYALNTARANLALTLLTL